MVSDPAKPPAGALSSSSISERLWNSCSDLANRALTCPFVTQLANGSLQKSTFQHYVAQDVFYLAAYAEGFERTKAYVTDEGAKDLLQELKDATMEELRLHEGYAKSWDINLEEFATPSQATKKYVDFLRQATSEIPSSFGDSQLNGRQMGEADSSHTSAQLSEGNSCNPPYEARQLGGEGERKAEEDNKECPNESANGERIVGGVLDSKSGAETHVHEGSGLKTVRQKGASEMAGGMSRSTDGLSIAGAIAAMVPCMRLYAFLGTQLSRGKSMEGHPYRKWIETYASPDFQASAAKLEAVLESVSQSDASESFDATQRIYEEAMLLELEFFAAQPGL